MHGLRILAALTIGASALLQTAAVGSDPLVYVGTYTGAGSKGIYAFRLKTTTGDLKPIGLAAETSNPSFLAVHPNQHFLYAVGENTEGTVRAFAIDRATGLLKALNAVSSKGNGPCHLAFDKTGKWLFVANYGSGSIAVLPVHDDGTLGEATASVQHSGSSVNPQRQAGPHAHSVNIAPDNRFLLVADLGLDELLVYRFDSAKGTLVANDPPFAKLAAGSGPRHLVFSPNGKFVDVVTEMKATISVMAYNAALGTLSEVQTISTIPAGFIGTKSGAEIAIHPNGKFLYASNRGNDSIAEFQLDPAKGTLTAGPWAPSGGKTPRNFAIDPSGGFLLAANQDSNNVVAFRIDSKTGALAPTGDVLDVTSPVSIVFAAAR